MALKLNAFSEALASFDRLVNVDLTAIENLDEILIDGLQNGKAKKFEYTLELCWKTIKEFLKAAEGIDEASPKKVIKAFYLAGHLGENSYLLLNQAIDDRNQLSHLYDPAIFNQIIARLPAYAELMNGICTTLKQAPK